MSLCQADTGSAAVGAIVGSNHSDAADDAKRFFALRIDINQEKLFCAVLCQHCVRSTCVVLDAELDTTNCSCGLQACFCFLHLCKLHFTFRIGRYVSCLCLKARFRYAKSACCADACDIKGTVDILAVHSVWQVETWTKTCSPLAV